MIFLESIENDRKKFGLVYYGPSIPSPIEKRRESLYPEKKVELNPLSSMNIFNLKKSKRKICRESVYQEKKAELNPFSNMNKKQETFFNLEKESRALVRFGIENPREIKSDYEKEALKTFEKLHKNSEFRRKRIKDIKKYYNIYQDIDIENEKFERKIKNSFFDVHPSQNCLIQQSKESRKFKDMLSPFDEMKKLMDKQRKTKLRVNLLGELSLSKINQNLFKLFCGVPHNNLASYCKNSNIRKVCEVFDVYLNKDCKKQRKETMHLILHYDRKRDKMLKKVRSIYREKSDAIYKSCITGDAYARCIQFWYGDTDTENTSGEDYKKRFDDYDKREKEIKKATREKHQFTEQEIRDVNGNFLRSISDTHHRIKTVISQLRNYCNPDDIVQLSLEYEKYKRDMMQK